MVIRREHFKKLGFNTNYRVCGEDVELCLALRQQLELNVMYCPRFSGEHGGEATRSNKKDQGGNSEDLTRMRGLHERFLRTTSNAQLRIELTANAIEADVLRSMILAQAKPASVAPSTGNHNHWEDQTHALQLARLKLEQKLKQAERGN